MHRAEDGGRAVDGAQRDEGRRDDAQRDNAQEDDARPSLSAEAAAADGQPSEHYLRDMRGVESISLYS